MRQFMEEFSLFVKQFYPYYLKCRKNTESKTSEFASTKNGRIILLSNCVVCDSKKLKFIKELVKFL